MERKYTLSATSGKKKISWNEKGWALFNRFLEKKILLHSRKKLMVVELQVYQETRLRVLQWKILHSIYPTDILLSKMKVRDSNKCSYCADTVDVIEHLFSWMSGCTWIWEIYRRIYFTRVWRKDTATLYWHYVWSTAARHANILH